MWNRSFIFTIILFIFIVTSCANRQDLLPKPRAFPKVEYPEKKYELFYSSACDHISFEKPLYAKVVRDETKRSIEDKHPCWFDLFFESLNGSVHCSYIPITHDSIFANLVRESFKVVDHVNKRSNFVEETVIAKDNIGGVFFQFEGPAASQVQFFLTDSTKHFFKASLYFNSITRPDSIAPLAAFIQEDMEKMIETFKWLD